MNSNSGGSKPTADSSDFEDADQTVVLDDSVGAGNGADEDDDSLDDESEFTFEKTVVLDDTDSDLDDIGDVSAEIKVEELIARIEASDEAEAARKRAIRRRLEEAAERRSLDDTYAIELGEDAD